jgi:excinuclease ABC subunit C
VDQENYRQMVNDLGRFLEGKTEPILERLRVEMDTAAQEMRYERAATVRDQIRAIETVVQNQKVVSTKYLDSDVIAMARDEKEACVQVFFIRGGKLIGREYFLLENTEDTSDPDVISGFIKQFYDQASNVPPQVLLPQEVEEAHIISQWLRSRRGGQSVELLIPRRGQKRELVQMASENAIETLTALKTQWEKDKNKQTQALAELQAALALQTPPNRIECYDISNTQGTAAVGSMVVFEQGIPNKNRYRRFNIRTVVGADDFASMEEVLMRRFNRWRSSQELAETPGKEPDAAFAWLPDVLIVDGGKGQLSRAVQVLEKFGLLGKVTVVGLAKQREELFLHGRAKPILLPRQSQGLYLLQRIRDEAHRFAITAHRNRRSKMGLASQLNAIPGIGPSRRKALLQHFGSLEGIKTAAVEELAGLKGITPELAESIKAHLE